MDAGYNRRLVPNTNFQKSAPSMNLIRPKSFKADFRAFNLNIIELLQWLMSTLDGTSCKISVLPAGKLDKFSKHSAATAICGALEDEFPRDLRRQQTRQILRIALVHLRLSDTEGRVGDLVYNVFLTNIFGIPTSMPDSPFTC